MGDFFSSLAFLVKNSGKRAADSGHINLTLFQKREKTEGKLGRGWILGGGGRVKGHFLR